MNALTQPTFLLFFCTNTLSMMGLWMLRLSLGWLAWQITESTFWTSMIVLAIWAPAGILGPAVAVYAENWPMRKASILCHFAMTLVCAAIWLINVIYGHTLFSLLCLTVIFGVITAIYHPIRLVLISLLVPKPYLTSAVGLSATAFNTCRIVGPALAGISIAGLGLSNTLFVAMLLYMPVQVGLLYITVRDRAGAPSGAESFLFRLKSGMAYAVRDKSIRFALGIAGINSFFVRGMMEIQPAIIGQILGGDSNDLAIATTAGGVGALVASGLLGAGLISKSRLKTMMLPASMLGMVVCLLLSLVSGLVGLVIVFTIVGFAVTATGIGSQMVIQLEVDENYRARILTWWATFSFGGLSIGGLLLGLLGEVTKIQYAVSGAAIVGLVALVYWAYRHRL